MRTFSATKLNAIANLPDVRKWLGGEGEIDLTPTLSNVQNYGFEVGELGGFVVHRLHGTRYECHTIFTPDRHGVKEVVALMEQSLEYMFLHTDCEEIITRVQEENVGARWLAKKGGFEEIAHAGEYSVMSLKLEKWAVRFPLAYAAGEQFHSAMEEKKKVEGSSLLEHTSDADNHNSMVGVCLLMAKYGQVVKGVNIYNRWATIYNYPVSVLINETPPLVDIQGAVLGLDNSNSVEIFLCR